MDQTRLPSAPMALVAQLVVLTSCNPAALCETSTLVETGDLDCDGSSEPTRSLRDAAAGRFHSVVPNSQLGWDVLCGPDRAGDGQGDIAVLASQFGQTSSREQFAGALSAPMAGEHDIDHVIDLKVQPTGRASFRHVLGLVEGGGLLLPHADNQLHAPAATEVVHATQTGRVNEATAAWGRADGQRLPEDSIAGSYTGPVYIADNGKLEHVFGGLVFSSIPQNGFVLRESLHRAVVVVNDQGSDLDGIVDSETGDLNGDGQLDLVLAYQSDPWVSVVFGPLRDGTREVPGKMVARFGPLDRDSSKNRVQSIAVADVTGDGVHDMVVGDKWHNDQRGSVYVWRGPFQPRHYGLDSVYWRFEGEMPGARLGEQVVAGDWDGDGVHGVAVSASHQDLALPGLIYLFGGPLGEGEALVSETSTIFRGEAAGALAGFAVEACDTDGDGQDEIVVGSPWLDVAAEGDRGGVVYWIPSPL